MFRKSRDPMPASVRDALAALGAALDDLQPDDVEALSGQLADIIPAGLSIDDLRDVLREELNDLLDGDTTPRPRLEMDPSLHVEVSDIRSIDGTREAAELLAGLNPPTDITGETADEAIAQNDNTEDDELAPVDLWLGQDADLAAVEVRSTVLEQAVQLPASPGPDETVESATGEDAAADPSDDGAVPSARWLDSAANLD